MSQSKTPTSSSPAKQALYGAMSLCPISVGPGTGGYRHGPGCRKPATATWKAFVQRTIATSCAGASGSVFTSTTRPGR